MSGPGENPPNASPGTGGTVIFYDQYDFGTDILAVDFYFLDLLGGMTAAHIHAPTGSPFAGAAGIATVEIRSTDGDHAAGYHTLLDLQVPEVYDPAFLAANGGTTTAAEAALINALKDGMAYMDIHSSAFPDGEIRGFLAAVPDATTTGSLLGLALLGLSDLIQMRGRITAG